MFQMFVTVCPSFSTSGLMSGGLSSAYFFSTSL
jgi:hypothetical protein